VIPVKLPQNEIERQSGSVPESPGHGTTFTASMYCSDYSPRRGWHNSALSALGCLPLHPGTLGLHYAQTIFEGLKAFKQPDGSLALFRPEQNAKRFNRSAARLAMPRLPEGQFLEGVRSVVHADQRQLSSDPNHSMYIRPLMYGSDVDLMLRPSHNYKFLVIAFIASAFFGEQIDAVSVLICRTHARAQPGGTGDVKCAPNYSPSFTAQQAAAEVDCQQVVWLDSGGQQLVEELGGMNLFFVRGSGSDVEIFTPPLVGTLLPGVTRDSILRIADRLGYRTAQCPLTIDEWKDDCLSGRISEVFACGTAASVVPVGRVNDGENVWLVGDGTMGPVTSLLHQELFNVQRGRSLDTDGWLQPIERE